MIPRAHEVCLLLCTLADEAEELLCLVDKPLAKRHLLECAKYARWAVADLKQSEGMPSSIGTIIEEET